MIDGVTYGNHSYDQTVSFEVQEVTEADKVGTEETLMINGRLVTAPYRSTRHSLYFHSDADYYSVDGLGSISFQINQHTGKCVAFHVHSHDDKSLPTKTKEECVEIAKTFLKQVVDDADAYRLISEKEFQGSHYWFTFNRCLGTLYTSDGVMLEVTPWGTITYFQSFLLGELKDVTPPDEETLRIAQEHVEQKLDEIFTSDDYTVTYPKIRPYLLKLDNGQLALRYYVTAELTFHELAFPGSAKTREEWAQIFVYL